jgi:hypothetical protein
MPISGERDGLIRFSAELAARKHRRTLSSFIEWATQEALNKTFIGGKSNETAAFVAGKVWDISEGRRFVNLATKYPEMLTHDEEVLWRFIEDLQILRKKGKSGLNIQLVGAFFDDIKACHKGEVTRDNLEKTLQGALENEVIE